MIINGLIELKEAKCKTKNCYWFLWAYSCLYWCWIIPIWPKWRKTDHGSCQVEVVNYATLPRSERKSKRLFDNRP